MDERRRKVEWRADTVAVVFLGATFFVVTVLLAQAFLTLRTHERVVSSTLDDFAGFAAERIASELNTTFTAIFLDQTNVSRAAHYGWLDGDGSGTVPRGQRWVPDGGIAAHFSMVDGRAVARGGEVDEETTAWLLDVVGGYARDAYPPPAPYVVLHLPDVTGHRAVVFRREQAYEGVHVYGFIVQLDAFGRLYASVVEDSPVLPQSIAQDVRPEDLYSIRLLLPPYAAPVFERTGPVPSEPVSAEAWAAKAGRMAVQVELDGALAAGLVSSGYAPPISLFAALAALTVGLLVTALGLMRRASKLNRMRETFVENVSHDLRTPLAQIRMFSETLLLGRLDDADERRRSVEIIRRQAANLSELVENILHASTREATVIRPTPTDLEEVLGDTLDGLAPAAEAVGATLDGAVSGAPEAVIDPTVLRRTLVNLIDNALKYGPSGQRVLVRVDHGEERVTVTVDDEGPGVPRRERLRVWERFRRLETPDAAVTGAGIGLSVVRRLAERHGGAVSFGEAPGRGARVTVTLAKAAR